MDDIREAIERLASKNTDRLSGVLGEVTVDKLDPILVAKLGSVKACLRLQVLLKRLPRNLVIQSLTKPVLSSKDYYGKFGGWGRETGFKLDEIIVSSLKVEKIFPWIHKHWRWDN
jgi:hypothetical protein